MKSRVFHMPHSKMLAYLFSAYGRVWLIISGLIVIALIILSIALHDIRFLICGLMFIFIIIPMIMSFLYLNYALSPEVALNVLPHSLQLDREGVKIFIYPKSEQPKRGEGSDKDDLQESGLTPQDRKEPQDMTDSDMKEEQPDPVVRFTGYADLINYTVGLDCIYFKLKGNGFLYIPTSAFENQTQFNEFVAALCELKGLSDKK